MSKDRSSVTTTNGERFTYEESCQLAFLIYKRFGRNLAAATHAWQKMLSNNTESHEFMELVCDCAEYDDRQLPKHKRLFQLTGSIADMGS